MKQLVIFFTIFFTISVQAQQNTELFNFRVDATSPTKIYFDTNINLTGSNTMGFFIGDGSDVQIVGVNIGGHFFTLNRPLTYWDNIAIRYEGGSDVNIEPFTLSYVDNNIPEPETSQNRYVTTSASGGGDGLSEATAWTPEEAFGTNSYLADGNYGGEFSRTAGQASAGMHIWIKAGEYTEERLSLVSQSGDVDNPIIFEGYKNTIGDITDNYLNPSAQYTDKAASLLAKDRLLGLASNGNFSTSEMPTFTGTTIANRKRNDIFLQIESSEYVIFKNLQIRNYAQGIQGSYNTDNNHLVFERINGYDFRQEIYSGTDTYGHFINLESNESYSESHFIYSDHCKFKNLVCANANLALVFVVGDGFNLFDNIRAYNTVDTHHKDAVDYTVAFNGHNNIARNIVARNFAYNPYVSKVDVSIRFHGPGVRGSYNHKNSTNAGSKYNLIERVHATDSAEGVYVRNDDSDYNVIKDCLIDRENVQFDGNGKPDYITNPWLGGITFWGNVKHNVVERVKVDGYGASIFILDNDEDGGLGGLPSDNIIINCLLMNSGDGVSITGATKTLPYSTGNNNKVINSTFSSGERYIGSAKYADLNSFEFINCQILGYTTSNYDNTENPINIKTPADPTEQNDKFTFQNCNFWENTGSQGVWTVSENNNIAVNPNLDVNLKPTSTTPISITEGGLTTSSVLFDYENVKRIAPYSIGAYEYVVPDITAPLINSLSFSDITSAEVLLKASATDNVGVTGYKVFQDDTFLTDILGDSLSYTVSGLTADTTYDFKVKAFDLSGNESVFSNIVNVTTLSNSTVNNLYIWDDAASGTLDVNTIHTSWITGTWGMTESLEIGGDNSTHFIRGEATEDDSYQQKSYAFTVTPGLTYNIKFSAKVNINSDQQVRVEGFTENGNLASSLTTSWQPYSIDLIADENTATIGFFANYENGGSGDQIDFDNVIIKLMDTEVPLVGSLSFSDITSAEVLLKASATDNVGVTGYKVFQDDTFLTDILGDSLSYTVSGLTADTTYDFKVKAFDLSGNESVFSNIVNVTTLSNSTVNNLYIWDDAASGTLDVNTIHTSWITGTWGMTESLEIGGDNSTHFIRGEATEDDSYQQKSYAFTVTPGLTYNIKFSAKVNINSDQQVRVEGFTENGNLASSLTTSWQPYSIDLIADENTATIGFFANYENGGSGDQIDFDNIIIEEVNSASKSSGKKVGNVTNQFAIYPTPANNSFTIEFSNNSLKIVEITISDVYGRLVYKTQTTENKLSINHNLRHGVYIINVKNNKENVPRKIIIE